MNKEQSMNLDPRQLAKFMKSPDFVASLSPESYEVAQFRVLTAKWPVNARIVYSAVQDGYTSMDTLPVATGLTASQVEEAVSYLTKKGMVSDIIVSPGGAEPL